MLGYPINPIIRETLDKKRKVLSRTKTPDPFSPRDKKSTSEYQKNIIRTPYVFMVSAPTFEEDEVKRGEMPTGTIILGNQEYSSLPHAGRLNYGKYLYNSRSKIPYRPTAGVKSLSSEYISSNNVQFVRHITINWSCFSLEDLNELSERFMTLGRKVYVEWGWAKKEKTRPTLIKEDGTVDIEHESETESEATRLKRKVIKVGEGDFDAAVGWVNNFNWTSREDGGFDCTTELTVQGINALDGPTDVNDDNNDDGTPKFRENPDKGTSGYSFNQALQDLPDTMVQQILSKTGEKPTTHIRLLEKREDIITDYKTAKGITEESSTLATLEGLSSKTQTIVYNNNFIVTQDEYKELDETRYNPQVEEDYGKLKVSKTSFEQASLTPQVVTKITRPAEKAWVRWGWFEDNIINKFYALIQEDGTPLSWFRSSIPSETTAQIRLPEQYGIDITSEIKGFKGHTVAGMIANSGEATLRNADRGTSSEKIVSQVDANKDYWFDGSGRSLKIRKRRWASDYNSTTVDSHPAFKTTDINKFIFPGKFDVKQDASINETRRNNLKAEKDRLIKAWKKDKNVKVFDAKQATKNEERIKALEIQRLEVEIRESKKFAKLAELVEGMTTEQIQQLLKEYNIKEDDVDLIEKGYVPYIYLLKLAKITRELTNFDDGKSIGTLRNIFINVKHLQDIFSNQSAVLGENMNALFDSITTETGGMIDLTIVADPLEEGCMKTQSRGIDTAEAEWIERLKEEGAIYEFPVWQNDSLVLSQELSSDISGENYKILLSKSYEERIKLDKKKGISLIHHADINALDSKGNIASNNKKYKGILDGVKPAFTQKGYENYGEPDGNVDFPLTDKGASVVPADIIAQAEMSERNKSRIGASEKDLEQRNNVFKELNIAYTADGRLKSLQLKEMKDKMNFAELKIEKKDGTTYVVSLPNVSDYGMVGLTNTLKMTGIAGLYPSILYTTTYLPEKFKKHSHFYATDVTQEIDSSTWTTTLSGRMTWKYSKKEDDE